MISNKKIECPDNLLDLSKEYKLVNAAIVNAGNNLSMQSAKLAFEYSLINPIFIGNKRKILKEAKLINWNISAFQIINKIKDNESCDTASLLAKKDKIKIIIKGNIHTDILMKSFLKKDFKLIRKKRLSHIWHLTINKNDKPLFITDGALNVNPRLDVKMHIIKNAIEFTKKLKINKPNIAILSGTEDPIKSMPSSIEAKELTKRSKKEKLSANVHGPLAFDNAVSLKAAKIKKINNKVAGKCDVIVVPNLETGNALVKMMVYFMGACSAGIIVGGKVPVVITSRSDGVQARLASIAAAVIASN